MTMNLVSIRWLATGVLSLLVLSCPGPGCGKREDGRDSSSPSANGSKTPVAAASKVTAFVDVTGPARLDFTHGIARNRIDNIMISDGAGGVILDYDGDGWMDVYLVNSGPMDAITRGIAATNRAPNRLFRNRGDGTFEDVTDGAGVAGGGFGTTAAAADYDNDGHTDLYVVNFGSGILYRNQGDGTFRDVTVAAGLQTRRMGISATFLDVDLDGYLDLFVANYLEYDPAITLPADSPVPYPGPLAYKADVNFLYRNRGDGTFQDVSVSSGIQVLDHRAMAVTSLDYDLDGDPDLYVSNDGTANLLLVNDGKGRFKDEALARGVALNGFGAADGSMGATVGDCNGDGLPDLFVTRFGTPSLYINSARSFFEDTAAAAGIVRTTLKLVSWGGNLLDYDNDGDLDLFIANGDPHFLKGMPALLLENDGLGRFARVDAGPFFQTLVNARGSGAFDFNNDGRLDVLISTLGGKAILLENRMPATNHWLALALEGARGNRDGFGTQVRVTVGQRTLCAEYRCPTSYVFQQDPRLHFGLGSHALADRIELRWPGGQTQTLTNVAADRILVVRQPRASRWSDRNSK